MRMSAPAHFSRNDWDEIISREVEYRGFKVKRDKEPFHLWFVTDMNDRPVPGLESRFTKLEGNSASAYGAIDAYIAMQERIKNDKNENNKNS